MGTLIIISFLTFGNVLDAFSIALRADLINNRCPETPFSSVISPLVEILNKTNTLPCILSLFARFG